MLCKVATSSNFLVVSKLQICYRCKTSMAVNVLLFKNNSLKLSEKILKLNFSLTGINLTILDAKYNYMPIGYQNYRTVFDYHMQYTTDSDIWMVHLC